MTSTTTLAAASVLAAARRARATANAAEAEVLAQALEWARLHEVTETDEAATWGDSPIPLAGEGAPLISEFCVAEFATALGLGAEGGRRLLSQALELAYRLPRVWVRVQTGDLAPWRGRRIAEETSHLSLEAVGFVDQQIAPFAHRVRPAETTRLIDEAVARFMPEHAREVAEKAAEGRYFMIDHEQVSFAGTSRIHGELDLADALDLEDAVRRGAAQLADLGSADSLDVRRSQALGVLARGDTTLELPARDLTLYVHLTGSRLSSTNGAAETRLSSTNGLVENAGGHLLSVEQIRTWCTGAKVTIQPVIDLNQRIATEAYEIPDRLREQVVLRDPKCVFPWCGRSSRRADLDHIQPYDQGGPTASENLAPLCRRHHRLKTFGGWTYTSPAPGTYLWHSPYGYHYQRDPHGTEDLTALTAPGPDG